MKTFLFAFCTTIFPVAFSWSQNVGIGTTMPGEKLEVKNSLRSTVKISSSNYDDTTELLLSNRAGNFGTDFSLKSVREEGLFISSNSDLPENTSPHSLVIRPNGFVGLNEPFSTARLTVRGNETTGDGQSAAIKIQNTAATNSWYLRSGAAGTNTPNNGFSIADNTGYHFNMAQGGNIGLGIAPSAAKLHVNGEVRIQGTNIFEFGAGVAGKEVNAGKVGYNAFGQNGLVFIGGGTNATNRAVYFFAEGGAIFNGEVNIGGALQLNGNSGTSGQVLTSNGASLPVWEDAAYSNNTRFAVNLSSTVEGSGFMSIISTIYNLNTTNITISGNTITINKTGLYRINGVIDSEVGYISITPAWVPEISAALVLTGATSRTIRLCYYDHFQRRSSVGNPVYYYSNHFSIDMYIPAGTDIDISKDFFWEGTPSAPNASMRLYANLIAE